MAILGLIFGVFSLIQATFVVGKPLCGVVTPVLSSSNFTQGQLMKTKRFVANVTPVRSPDRAEHMYDILGTIFNIFANSGNF